MRRRCRDRSRRANAGAHAARLAPNRTPTRRAQPVVKRLLADSVANEVERQLSAIPERDREHSDGAIEGRLDPPWQSRQAAPRCRNDRATVGAARSIEFGANRVEV